LGNRREFFATESVVEMGLQVLTFCPVKCSQTPENHNIVKLPRAAWYCTPIIHLSLLNAFVCRYSHTKALKSIQF